MKKKVATAAIAAMTMTFLAGCSSRGTYAKYLTLGEYKGLSVTKVKTEVTDDDVEAEIESALDENAEYTDVDRAAKDGDQVNIDFDGSIDGEAWDSDTDYDLVIGSEDFQPEFEEHLIGAKAGDTLEFTITLSDDYDGDYAGKDADFKVTVNAVQSDAERNTPMNYKPGEEEALDMIIPKYIASLLYGALNEAAASENGARMQAMDAATSNAEDMMESLELQYNRARQGSITQELTEIIAGAEAVE